MPRNIRGASSSTANWYSSKPGILPKSLSHALHPGSGRGARCVGEAQYKHGDLARGRVGQHHLLPGEVIFLQAGKLLSAAALTDNHQAKRQQQRGQCATESSSQLLCAVRLLLLRRRFRRRSLPHWGATRAQIRQVNDGRSRRVANLFLVILQARFGSRQQ